MADSEKQRRDLYAISLGVILFNVAGGELKAESSTVFGAITLARPWILVPGATMMWLYFLWQFRLATKAGFRTFLDDIDQEIRRSKLYKDFCLARLARLLEVFVIRRDAAKEAADRGAKNDQQLVEANAQIITSIETNMRNNFGLKFERRSWMSRIVRHRAYMNPVEIHSQNEEGAWNTAPLPVVSDEVWSEIEKDVPWTTPLRWKIVRRSAFRAAAYNNAFSEFLLPYAAAGAAEFSAVLRCALHYRGLLFST